VCSIGDGRVKSATMPAYLLDNLRQVTGSNFTTIVHEDTSDRPSLEYRVRTGRLECIQTLHLHIANLMPALILSGPITRWQRLGSGSCGSHCSGYGRKQLDEYVRSTSATARAMVFCTTTDQVNQFWEAWRESFLERTIRVHRYHAGLDEDVRTLELENFAADTL
jgi:superfamily II DNA helicase RecQ